MDLKNQLQFHHVGCLTNDIDKTLSIYLDHMGFRKVSEAVSITSQQVKVCFIQATGGPLVELIQPTGKNKALEKLMNSNNPYYHIGYLVKNVDATIKHLQDAGFYLVNRFNSEAFENRECAFMYSAEMHLIELIEE